MRKLTERGVSLTEIERRIGSILQAQLRGLGEEYRVVLVDCAPGISPFTTAAICMADLVLVPTIPDAPSFLGLDAFLRSVHQEMTNKKAHIPPHVLITRYAPATMMAWLQGKGKRGKTNHHREYLEKINELPKKGDPAFEVLKTKMLETPLMPHAMSLVDGKLGTEPTFAFKYPGKFGKDLSTLADEIMEVLI